MAKDDNKVVETFLGNLKQFVKNKEFIDIFLTTGVKPSGKLIFANDKLVIISNNDNGKTYIKPSSIATFQLAEEFKRADNYYNR